MEIKKEKRKMEMNILKELMNRTQKNSKLTSMSLLGDKEVFIFD